MAKFKVGDIVIGLASASEKHCYTIQGWKGKVTEISTESRANMFRAVSIKGDSRTKYTLSSENFKLFKSAPKVSKVNFLLRYDLETDPFEEYETLKQVKDRIEELVNEEKDLKLESIIVYEIKSVNPITIKKSVEIKGI